ncbi:proline-rich protein 2-like [Lontra canadensis]|uniref:proline-rich protein 2-like n=1 Tax=Lontra canadensis TaxID=76717 RepID=UPI0013F39A2B|nr:proline-rich protein 2-like [Lontra canadensis]
MARAEDGGRRPEQARGPGSAGNGTRQDGTQLLGGAPRPARVPGPPGAPRPAPAANKASGQRRRAEAGLRFQAVPRPELRELPGRGKGPPDPGTPRPLGPCRPTPLPRREEHDGEPPPLLGNWGRKLARARDPQPVRGRRRPQQAAPPAGWDQCGLGAAVIGLDGAQARPPRAPGSAPASQQSRGLPLRVQPRRCRVGGGRPRPLLRPPAGASPAGGFGYQVD